MKRDLWNRLNTVESGLNRGAIRNYSELIVFAPSLDGLSREKQDRAWRNAKWDPAYRRKLDDTLRTMGVLK